MAKNDLIMTSFGTAMYPHISKPDTDGKYADNKYKTKLVLSDADYKRFIDDLKKVVGTIPKGYKVPYKEDDDGKKIITAKSNYAPAVFDMRNNKLSEDEFVGGGSVIRIAVEPYDYEKGISLRLKQVQVKERQGGGGSSVFDAEPHEDDESEAHSGNALDL